MCFTQSQAMLAASQEEFDYEEAVGMANKNRDGQLRRAQVQGLKQPPGVRRRGGRQVVPTSERDRSVPPPTLDACLLGLQTVLRRACRIVCLELVAADGAFPAFVSLLARPGGGGGGPLTATSRRSAAQVLHGEVSKTVRTLWKSYLEAWMEGAEYYGALYPEFRFSFRGFFLKRRVRFILHQTLAARAAKELKERVENETDGEDGDESDEQRSSSSEEVLPDVIHSNRTGRRNALDPVEGDDTDDRDDDNEGDLINNDNSKNGDGEIGNIGDDDNDDDDDVASVASELSVFNTKLSTKSRTDHGVGLIPKLLLLHQKRLRNLSKAKRKKQWSTYRMGRKEAALLLPPSMIMVTGMLWTALAPYGVIADKMIHWVGTGALPILNAFSTLLPTEQQTTLREVSGFFRQTVPPTAAQLTRAVKCLHLASGYEPAQPGKEKLNKGGVERLGRLNTPGRVIQPSTVPIILASLVSELGLSQKVLNYSLALMGLGVAEETLVVENPLKGAGAKSRTIAMEESDSVSIGKLPPKIKLYALPPPLSAARPEKLSELSKILAVVVVACKLIPHWGDNLGYKRPSAAPSSKEGESNEDRGRSRKRIRVGERFIPWDEQHFRLLGNGRMETDYVDYLEESIMNVKSTVLPRFVATLKIPEASTASRSEERAVKEIDIDRIDEHEGCRNSDQKGEDEKPVVTPSVQYLTFKTKAGPISTKRRRIAANLFEYVLTRRCDLENTRALDPPLGPLIEYMAYKSGTMPGHILDYLVQLDKELVTMDVTPMIHTRKQGMARSLSNKAVLGKQVGI